MHVPETTFRTKKTIAATFSGIFCQVHASATAVSELLYVAAARIARTHAFVLRLYVPKHAMYGMIGRGLRCADTRVLLLCCAVIFRSWKKHEHIRGTGTYRRGISTKPDVFGRPPRPPPKPSQATYGENPSTPKRRGVLARAHTHIRCLP